MTLTISEIEQIRRMVASLLDRQLERRDLCSAELCSAVRAAGHEIGMGLLELARVIREAPPERRDPRTGLTDEEEASVQRMAAETAAKMRAARDRKRKP